MLSNCVINGCFARNYDRTAYKQLVFCEVFHSEETGWRECTTCGKVSPRFLLILNQSNVVLNLQNRSRFVLIGIDSFLYWQRLHCGCIASSSLLVLLDTGGVSCKGCIKNSKFPSVRPIYECWDSFFLFFRIYLCLNVCARGCVCVCHHIHDECFIYNFNWLKF